MKIRIGQGFDAHKFVKGRSLILGGIEIPHEFGLAGHSDADVLTHAVIDSLLGALSLGNIGSWFPDNDSKYKNADSIVLLKTVLSNPAFSKWQISNIDATIITEKPKLNPYIEKICKSLATALQTSLDNISVKGKTTEKMGFCGREEGIVVLVNTLLIEKERYIMQNSKSCYNCSSSAENDQIKLTLFTNGTVYIKPNIKAKNLLIQEDKVIGFNVNEKAFKNTEIIDLKGGAAYPGFIDNHTHLLVSAIIKNLGIELKGASTSKEIAKILAAESSKLPDGVPIFGHGFIFKNYEEWSLKDLEILDEATGNRPVMLTDQLIHSYIANSAAMKKSGLTGETPNPPGGKIIFEDGKPTGMLRENAGYLVGNKAIFPFFPNEKLYSGMEEILNIWSSMGYTSILEMMGGPGGQAHKPELYRQLEKDGKLPVRVNYTYTIYNSDDIDDSLQNIGNDTEMVRFAGLKLFIDGAAGNGGAWTTWENTLGKHGIYAVYYNDSYGKKYNINRMIEKVDAYGLDIRYHTHGDMAIEIVLKAIENVFKKNGRLNSVHTFYHLGFITDDQIARMKKLGKNIIAGLQPSLGWEYMKEITPMFYGKHNIGSYPYRKIREAGIKIGMGSDFCSNKLELSGPTMHMKAALTGIGDTANHPPLTMNDLIKGFTTGSAASTYIRDIGVLDIGYKADIVIYNKDLYSIPSEELDRFNPKVISTWINGKKVHEA